MLGQLNPDGGSVLIDGCNAIRGIRRIGSVFQGDGLINGTLRENLTLFDGKYSDQEIWSALAITQIDDFVQTLPMRLQTSVGDQIGGLSGGQKQRLLLARALLLKPKVLVLDEATAALDVETESNILRQLFEMDCTIFSVAHRPEVLHFADRVLKVTEAGQVEEVPVGSKAAASGPFLGTMPKVAY